MSKKEQEKFSLKGKTDQKKGPRLSERKPRFIVWIYLVAFVALMIHLLFFVNGIEPNEVEYSFFLDYVSKGYVEEVSIVNDQIVDGKYTAEAIQEGRVEVKPPPENLLTGPDMSAVGRFTSEMPSDHDLVQYLVDYNTAARSDGKPEIIFKAERREDWLGGILMWIIPLAFILAMWIFLMRRMSPGSQVLNIGKNKAVLFDTLGDMKLTFDDVAGLEEAKQEVVEIVDFLKTPSKFTRLGGKLPKGVLLVGPPGTGKTLLAKAVAGEAEVPFFSLSGSDFVEMFVGVGAARVRDLFRQAKEKAPCIIFIDEIDAIGRSRGRGNMMGANDERENTLNQLLVEMDGFNTDTGVIIMAATNRPDVLDSALLRPGRFDRQILLDKPDRRERAEIFKVHTRSLILGGKVSMQILASQTPGFAGAEIANVCNEAALLAAREDKDAIEMDDFEKSIDRIIAGLEKKNKIISPGERKIVAYHEAGHAIAGWFLENTDPVVKVSIVPRGLAALGYAQYLPEERYLYTREALVDRMVMAIGGRVAEELVFGKISTGAQNDLERITKMAYAMVVDYGMSEKLGYVSYNLSGGNNDTPIFQKPYSDETATMIDSEVRSIIGDVRNRARKLLREKNDKLEEMAQALLKKEVLGAVDILRILGPRPFGDYVVDIPESATEELADSSAKSVSPEPDKQSEQVEPDPASGNGSLEAEGRKSEVTDA